LFGAQGNPVSPSVLARTQCVHTFYPKKLLQSEMQAKNTPSIFLLRDTSFKCHRQRRDHPLLDEPTFELMNEPLSSPGEHTRSPCSGMSHPSLLLDGPILYPYDTYRERADESASSRDAIRSRVSLHLQALPQASHTPSDLGAIRSQTSIPFAHERATSCSQMSHPAANWPSGTRTRRCSLSCLKTGSATGQFVYSTKVPCE